MDVIGIDILSLSPVMGIRSALLPIPKVLQRMIQSWYMSSPDETEVVLEKPKRAPRKRAPKVVFSDDAGLASVNSTPRKRFTKKTTVTNESDTRDERSSARKAPTPIAAERAKTRRGRKNITVVAILLLLGIGSSAAVGFSDKGQIDVAQTIAQRNDAARAAGQPEIIIPVQTTLEPNGGLTGVGDDPKAQPPAQATTTPETASSTEATASTTVEAVSIETASTT